MNVTLDVNEDDHDKFSEDSSSNQFAQLQQQLEDIIKALLLALGIIVESVELTSVR